MKGLEVKTWLAAFLLFSCIPPFFFWNTAVQAILVAILSVLLLTMIDPKDLTMPRFVIVTLYLMLMIFSKGNVFGSLLIVFLCPLFLCSNKAINLMYEKLKKILCFFLILSLPGYFLFSFGGVDLPYTTIPPLNSLRDELYKVYPFFVQISSNIFDFNYRFHGIFDEPGVIGTFSGIFLLLDRMNFRKFQNWVFLISGTFSMSLVFFVMVAVGVLFFFKTKYRIIFIAVIGIMVVLLYNNEIAYYYIFRRLEFNDEGLVGYNRTNESFDLFYNQFKNSSDFYFGLGHGEGDRLDEGGASYKHLIIDYGIIFFIMYCIAFAWMGLSSIKNIKKFALFVICFVFVIFQRPFITNIFYSFLLFSPIFVLSAKNKSNYKDILNEN